ncbi:MAG: phosphatase PAP2 family protein [Bacteroidetes bacterium]|nr:MAG: phosphatase PAP2 family protein [Bacteroidota bacterium]
MGKIILFFQVFALISISGIAQESDDQKVLAIHHRYLDEAIELTKHCVGFSPPVSGRAFAYLSVGIYESTIDFTDHMRSLSGQMNGYSRTVFADKKKYNRFLVAIACDHEMMSHLYRNMPPRNQKNLQQLFNELKDSHGDGFSKKVNERSLDLGKRIANEIIEWSKTDGGEEGFIYNFPDEYTPPECLECWVKTTPGYLPSLLPYWGSNRWMMKGSEATMSGCEVIPFSTDTNSLLYKDAYSILENSKLSDPKFEIIAEYWDDSPGYSGTPSGHFYTLARTISEQKELDLKKAIELYVKLGIAMNEAYIASWQLKYKFSFIRPITYIQRYIDPQFNTRLSTPPFPEFPSGHSYQSAAGGEIFKQVFGDQVSFIDSTNVDRDDINGAPRSYASFTELVEEVSWSRFYGGIHFRKTLDISMDYGSRLGRFVAEKLVCIDEE